MRARNAPHTYEGRQRWNADGPNALPHFASDRQQHRVSHHPGRLEGRPAVQTTHPRHSTAPPTMSYRLPVSHGWAVLPDATRELGGLTPTPNGFRARLFIGGARDIDEYTARTLAAVLARSAGYQVHGTDPDGLAAVVATLAALLGR